MVSPENSAKETGAKENEHLPEAKTFDEFGKNDPFDRIIFLGHKGSFSFMHSSNFIFLIANK
jgi:hypothetical protein